MSYNLLSGSVEFVGDELQGLIENIVNTHAAQSITGPKTFTNITASGGNTVGLVVGGALEIDTELRHSGDAGTKLDFPNPNELTLNAANQTHLFVDGASSQKKLVLNPNGADIDFQLKDSNNDSHLLFDSDQKVFTFGNSAQPDNSVFVHVTGAVANASLLSVGNRKDPVLAVSGAVQKADWKVKVQGLLSTSANIEAGGVVTGSLGIRGELLNVGAGLEHLALAGQKKLSAKADSSALYAGLAVNTSGIGLNVAGLTEEASINTDSAQPDWVLLLDNDGAGNYANKKQKLSTILANTAKSSMSNTGVDSGGGLYSAFSTFAADGRTAEFSGLTTPSNKLLRIYGSAPTFTIEQALSPAIINLTSSYTLLNNHTIADHLTASYIGVNIGNIHPATERLEVHDGHLRFEFDTTAANIEWRTAVGGAGVSGFVNYNNSNEMTIANQMAGPLFFRTSGTGRMAIVAGGNVGIGTDSPTVKLEVDGNIKGNTINASTLQIGGSDITAAVPEINRLASGATPDASGAWVGLSRWAKAVLSVPPGDVLAANTAHGLSVDIPDNALIIGGIIDVITTFESDSTDAATIAIHVETANDIVSAIAISDGTNPWDAGLKTVVPSRTAPIKTTASRTITATTAAGEALDAGKAIIWLEYVLSDGS